MKPPSNTKQNLSSSDKTKIIVVIIFLAILLTVLGILLGLVLRRSGFQFSLPVIQSQSVPASPAASVAPIVIVPTVDCGAPTLTIGSSAYEIQTIGRAADGSLTVPPDTSNIAYWIEGTNPNHVFVLSPTPNNSALETSLKSGEAVTVVWADCAFEEYLVSAIEVGQPDASTLLAQPASGITIFLPTAPSVQGFVIRAEQPGTQETPGAPNIDAEITLLEVSTSQDRTTISVYISILNTGTVPFSLSTNDVSLTFEGATQLAPANVKPSLPYELKPGSSGSFHFIFPRPSSNMAVFKILNVEFDLVDF